MFVRFLDYSGISENPKLEPTARSINPMKILEIEQTVKAAPGVTPQCEVVYGDYGEMYAITVLESLETVEEQIRAAARDRKLSGLEEFLRSSLTQGG